MFGLPKLFVPRGVRQISTDTDTDTDSELLCVVFARWLLFAQRALCFQSGRTLIASHTRTASFRALGHTGFVTTGPTLVYLPFWKKNVWELPL
ncbi:MAG: hypothetical protein J07HQW1_02006 [Haloquadratum walsbyi J07HQW1]|uniref:Uncharacterized protein n=1 Tax=Haloquadratum walsbyi J07HQW1 TaxID=1238424 RepID=U1PEC7_9EURY|nr:MAG: hypothetical protein J07HQW1_02006 [Haloquadratum walsbyi J07HQW1]